MAFDADIIDPDFDLAELEDLRDLSAELQAIDDTLNGSN